MFATNTLSRNNHSIFIPFDTGSPRDGAMRHITSLGQLARLDFERFAVAGETIFAVESDTLPVSQQDEEARIGTLGYALRKLEHTEDAAEFIRCLNAICEGGDARCRQTTASHYYHEISTRGTNVVLKEMGLLAMRLARLNAVTESLETDEAQQIFDAVSSIDLDSTEENISAFFTQEVASLARMIRGRRKSACFARDEQSEWLNELEASGVELEELDEAFLHAEAMDQYDEGGAILMMSSHERTIPCGRVEAEFVAEDLPERAQYLITELRRGYAGGRTIDEMWDDLNAQLDAMFPVTGKTETGKSFYSHANRSWQQLARQVLEAILQECQQDFHLSALRTSAAYRYFHREIRGAKDARLVSESMKRAYESRQSGALSLKHFTALKTVAELQRERLQSQQLSVSAFRLVKEIQTASTARLRYFSWAFYGANQPAHVIHALPRQEQSRVWATLKTRQKTVYCKVQRQSA